MNVHHCWTVECGVQSGHGIAMELFDRLDLKDDGDDPLSGMSCLSLHDDTAKTSSLQCHHASDVVADEMDLDILSDTVEDVEDVEDVEVPSTAEAVPSTSLVKSLLSPTNLGVAAGTADDFSLRHLDKNPVNIQINHNHFYDDKKLERSLPLPWSASSRPAQITKYNLLSYSQFALNTVTAVLIVAFVITLIKLVKLDLYSKWELQKQTLANESILCGRKFVQNKCATNTKPALLQKCYEWALCKERDNTSLLNNRSVVFANLLGSMLNSFFDPITVKTASVITGSVVAWLYICNFVFGFTRARTYYGPAVEKPHIQELHTD